MNAISVDPGNKGAIVLWDGLKVVDIINIPLDTWGNARRIPSRELVRGIYVEHQPQFIIIERVTPGPSDGPGNAGTFMLNLGVLYGAAVGFRTEFVRPQVWKAYAGLQGKVKKASVGRAITKHPEAEQFIDCYSNAVDRADAVLIGDYYLKVKNAANHKELSISH